MESMLQLLTTVHKKHFGPTFYALLSHTHTQAVGANHLPLAPLLLVLFAPDMVFKFSLTATKTNWPSPLLVLFLFTFHILVFL
jgi:MFS superfamily sulfate permease-like transporter